MPAAPSIKVVLATPSLHPDHGGPAYSVTEIGRYLESMGADVTFVTRKIGAVPPPGKMGSFLSLLGAEIVHNFGVWTPFNHAVASAASLLHKPVVFCPMGMLEPWALQQKQLKKQLGMWAYQARDIRAARVLHATAKLEAEHLVELGFTNPIAVIPHGIDLPPWPLTEASNECPKPRTALFLSRINPKKGLLELVEAWAALRPTGWRVVIAGPDENGHRAQVEAAVARHGLETSFQFEGATYGEKKHQLIASADLFVLPTFSENFGLVIPEALAHGVPVVTTTGTPWEELVSERCGWWVEPGAAALSVALREAFSMRPEDLRAMGLRGRAMVEARYAWPSIIKMHIELYRWMLSLGPRPAFMM